MTSATERTRRAWGKGVALLLAVMSPFAGTAASETDRTNSRSSYPHRPIRLLVGLPAGGSADILARIIAPRFGENLGQNIVVDNRPGATGVVAAQIASKAMPDGYTLMLRASFFGELVASMHRKMTYDIEADFDPVSLVWKSPNVLVVSPTIAASSMVQLIELAKASPGKFNYGSAGFGSSTHLAMELVKRRAGIDLVHVSYPGAPQAIAALLGGDAIQVMFGNIAAQLPHIRSGKLRALAVTSAHALPALPGVPPLGETDARLKDLEISVWVGVTTPASVPRPILTKLNTALVKALGDAEVAGRMVALSADPAPSTVAQFADFQKSELRRWTPIVRSLQF